MEAVEAGSGTEALQILGMGGDFAVVILDWDLPGINGIQVATEIRRDAKLKSLPIMMISGRPHSSDADYALKAGVNDYVIKPFTRETILHSLTRMGLIES